MSGRIWPSVVSPISNHPWRRELIPRVCRSPEVVGSDSLTKAACSPRGLKAVKWIWSTPRWPRASEPPTTSLPRAASPPPRPFPTDWQEAKLAESCGPSSPGACASTRSPAAISAPHPQSAIFNHQSAIALAPVPGPESRALQPEPGWSVAC